MNATSKRLNPLCRCNCDARSLLICKCFARAKLVQLRRVLISQWVKVLFKAVKMLFPFLQDNFAYIYEPFITHFTCGRRRHILKVRMSHKK